MHRSRPFSFLPLLLAIGGQAQPGNHFVENRGQWPEAVVFRASLPEANVWCERGSILIDRGIL
jgi:hypothetical protein